MRKRNVIKIDDKEITVKELTVKEIISIGNKLTSESKEGFDSIKAVFGEHFAVGIEGISFPELWDLAPSELDQIYKAFKEVNHVFFQVARQAGLIEMIETIKEALKQDFLKSLATL